jgi:hypothetical protein
MENAQLEPVHCEFGDDIFFAQTDKEHRSQLLMQAYVLDLRTVVYVRATETGVHVIVIVSFTDEMIQDAELALTEHEDTIRWLHHPDKLKFPRWIPTDSKEREIITSHWWLWDLLRRKAMADGPLPPIRTFRYGLQVLYNKAKTGVDGLTQGTNGFRSQTMKLKWEQNVATKCLRRAYHGSFIAERLVQNKHLVTSKGEYKGLSHLRRKLNEYMSLGEYVEDVTKDLLLRAAELSGGKAKAASTTKSLHLHREHPVRLLLKCWKV